MTQNDMLPAGGVGARDANFFEKIRDYLALTSSVNPKSANRAIVVALSGLGHMRSASRLGIPWQGVYGHSVALSKHEDE